MYRKRKLVKAVLLVDHDDKPGRNVDFKETGTRHQEADPWFTYFNVTTAVTTSKLVRVSPSMNATRKSAPSATAS
jgi:hypothetical protein